ncbi:hypothetical protein ABIE38_002141, partial [Dietzia sp. 2505]
MFEHLREWDGDGMIVRTFESRLTWEVGPKMTTASSAAFGALRAVPEPLETLGAEALSEVAR